MKHPAEASRADETPRGGIPPGWNTTWRHPARMKQTGAPSRRFCSTYARCLSAMFQNEEMPPEHVPERGDAPPSHPLHCGMPPIPTRAVLEGAPTEPVAAKLHALRLLAPLLAGAMHAVQAVVFFPMWPGLALASVGSCLWFTGVWWLVARGGRPRLGTFLVWLEASVHSAALTVLLSENHRTDTAFEDALISKTFVFEFINKYAPAIYQTYSIA